MSKSNPKDGRVPPLEHRYPKGTSGNPGGRPRGSVSTKRLTRDAAMQKVTLNVKGSPKEVTLLEAALRTLRALAMTGLPAAVALEAEVRRKLTPPEPEELGACLVVPEKLAPSEWIKRQQALNENRRDPRAYADIRSVEHHRAMHGEGSPFGRALLASHKKWGRYRNSPNKWLSRDEFPDYDRV